MPIASSAAPDRADIYYEDHGFDDDPPLLLIAGLGNQLLFWEDEFIRGLLDRMFRVIVFDNRDTGLSTGFTEQVDVFEVLAGAQKPAYTIGDMVLDSVGVLDAVGVERAHVLGVSLGGMVAQGLAIEFPNRVQSLTLLSSTTGSPDVGQATQECLEALLRTPPADPEAAFEATVAARALWSTPSHYDENITRDYFRRSIERGEHPGASNRQMAAVLSGGDREDALGQLDVPALVLHGTIDPLIAPDGGERLASLIPDAELVMLDDMAHDFPPHFWAPVIEAVTQLAIRSA